MLSHGRQTLSPFDVALLRAIRAAGREVTGVDFMLGAVPIPKVGIKGRVYRLFRRPPYPELRALVHRGFLAVREAGGGWERGFRPRWLYRITNLGCAASD